MLYVVKSLLMICQIRNNRMRMPISSIGFADLKVREIRS